MAAGATRFSPSLPIHSSPSHTSPTTPKNFFIFGQGISHSMSPIIHLAAFKYHKLPHTYEIVQTATIDEVSPLVSSPTFGGASVTMPHKLQIGRFCDSVSEDARIIGAINTLIVEEGKDDEGKIIKRIAGANTDWNGLVACLKKKGEGIVDGAKSALVIGAGGASRAALYALHRLGVQNILLVNRTRATAEKISKDFSYLFNIAVISSLSEIGNKGMELDIIIGTIPADKTSTEDFPGTLFAKERGVCVDMAYKPRLTPLLVAAGKNEGWKTVTGVEVLLEQAFVQSELWLGVSAPQEFMVKGLEWEDERMAMEGMVGGKL